MKKILLLMVSVMLWGCQKTAVLETDYLKLKYPMEWSVNTENALASEPGFEHVMATYLFDMGKDLKSQIIINVETKDPEMSLDEYRSTAKEFLSENIPNIEYVAEETVTINGASSITLAHNHSGRNWIQIWTMHEERIYTTTLATSDAFIDDARTQLQQLLGSIELKTMN